MKVGEIAGIKPELVSLGVVEFAVAKVEAEAWVFEAVSDKLFKNELGETAVLSEEIAVDAENVFEEFGILKVSSTSKTLGLSVVVALDMLLRKTQKPIFQAFHLIKKYVL